MLRQLLSDDQYQLVLKAANRAQDEQQLPLVAWTLGFVSLEQLAQLLEGELAVSTVQPELV